MKNPLNIGVRLLYAVGLAAVATAGMNANAQTLLADFSGSSFNSSTDTLTSTADGQTLTASAVSGTANTAGLIPGTVTIGNGFEFDADTVTGLQGLTSYTIAIGFSANPTENEGLFGADLPLAGAGDQQLASEGTGTGYQLHGLAGNNAGGDNSVYSVYTGNGNYNGGLHPNVGLVDGPGTSDGVVLVVNGTTEQLYVNGYLQDSETFGGTGVNPFGYTTSTGTSTATSTYEFGIGNDVSNAVDYDSNALQGTLTDFQIYGGALSSTQAEALSLEVAVAPEPSTWAMLACALGVLGAITHLRRRSQMV